MRRIIARSYPRRVEAVMDSVGQATWPHTLESVGRGGTVVTMGITTGNDPSANLMRLFVEQVSVSGTIMGTREDMNNLIQFVISTGILAQRRPTAFVGRQ
jgi:D-arabinose 1-dehydrogenase-like Zn-dependent alcohol dehydrogenase